MSEEDKLEIEKANEQMADEIDDWRIKYCKRVEQKIHSINTTTDRESRFQALRSYITTLHWKGEDKIEEENS